MNKEKELRDIMTEDEAQETLQCLTFSIAKKANSKNRNIVNTVLAALGIAIMKFEKSKIRKPGNIECRYIPELMADILCGECPKCGATICESGKFCQDCGQEIDWKGAKTE